MRPMTDRISSPEVSRFMAAYQKLRSIVGENANCVVDLAEGDAGVADLCNNLDSAAIPFRHCHLSREPLFAAPVDPKFIAAWRDYEQKWQNPVGQAALICILGGRLLPTNRSNIPER